jgi:hypothetical protein
VKLALDVVLANINSPLNIKIRQEGYRKAILPELQKKRDELAAEFQTCN